MSHYDPLCAIAMTHYEPMWATLSDDDDGSQCINNSVLEGRKILTPYILRMLEKKTGQTGNTKKMGMRTSIFSETTSGTSENKMASFKLDAC